jgi:hypothetical protein
MMRTLSIALFASALFVCEAANAAIINFTFSGSGSGTFGASAFSDTSFEIRGTADTTQAGQFPGFPGTYWVPFLSSSMTLAGFASDGVVGTYGSTSQPLDMYSFAGGFGLESMLGSSPNANLIDFRGILPATYDLTSAMGPFTFDPLTFSQFDYAKVTLNGQAVHFDTMNPVTFTATLQGPTTGAVPEPASWAMLIAGFGAVGATMRHRRNSPRVAYS